jgi:NTP pyrophosphatase (non-canonical NTP hydrolase)
MYYLYHIPGKKIGVTRDLNNRVTLVQGYKENEYEVLEQSDDIDYISDREIELQQSYGYKKDRKLYKQLFNKMKINATEQTSTFPVPVNKLKGRLQDNIGLTWKTEFGQFEITKENIRWIMQNVKTSMFNVDRSYIYNKAFYEAFFNQEHTPVTIEDLDSLRASYQDDRFDLIRNWALVRGIYDGGNSHTQYVKLMEEAGELAKALLQKDKEEIQDAVGDMVVVLTNLAELEGMSIEDCIDSAYTEISARTGKMINGTFVKDAN